MSTCLDLTQDYLVVLIVVAEDHPLLDGDGFLARHGRGLVGQGIRATAP